MNKIKLNNNEVCQLIKNQIFEFSANETLSVLKDDVIFDYKGYIYKLNCAELEFCPDYSYGNFKNEIIESALKKHFGKKVKIKHLDNDLYSFDDKEIEIYSKEEYASLAGKHYNFMRLPNTDYYFLVKSIATKENLRTKKIQKILSDHFNVPEKDIRISEEYEDEYSIDTGSGEIFIEVCNRNTAINNEMAVNNNWEDVTTEERIGCYRRLCNSDYYFKHV